ncbi:hypothetical protein I2I11_11810 [Pontibacter sp. 172403-2]|uniref:hypothetical protein n=1 Tax=Pontibacter rufus TaxID=2791028 RepID=UPI0018AFA0BF|nr:hypothetical protein [Pontibacter sp. 172403-2]MBF9253979.1 hypothetical protein [Pontibacter sp. 172403-2]
MKLKNRILPAMFLFGVVALSACEQNEDQDSVSPNAVLQAQGQISHVMLDSAEVTSYNFANTLLSQVNHYNKETGELESTEKYERDPKGKVVKASTYAADGNTLLAQQAFTYDSNGLLNKTLTSYFNGNAVEYAVYATYEYNADRKLVKKSFFEGKEGIAAAAKSFTKYEVLPNGNYGQEKQYVLNSKGEAVLFSTTTYSYDTNKNPFYAFAEPGKISSPNNLIAASTEVHASKKTYNYKYTYDYDAQGLPISQTVTTPKGKSETFAYLYSN